MITKKSKLGIVGCGGAAILIHLPILLQLSSLYEVVVVGDFEPHRAEYCAKRFGIQNFTNNIDELLRHDIDAVAILTSEHEDIIEKAISYNKHIFCEKPISLDYEYSKKIYNNAKENNLIFQVGLMRFYDSVLVELHKKLKNKNIINSIFLKNDGSDLYIRKELLPDGFKPYNFDKFLPPLIPSYLNHIQKEILKKILWSGIHLLTAIQMFYSDVRPIKVTVNKDFSNINCLLEGKNNKDKHHILLVLNDSNIPTYNEKIEFFTLDGNYNVNFSSPYLLTKNTQIRMELFENSFIERIEYFNYENPFKSMWQNFAQTLSSKNSILSNEKTLSVEKLALDIVNIL